MSGLRERGGADAVQIHILEIRLDRYEAISGRRVTVDVNHRITGDEAHRDDVQRLPEGDELGLADALAPDVAAHLVEHLARIALKNDLSLIDDGHAAAQLAHVFDDVRRQNDDHLVADLREQIEEAVSLVRVEARRRLVDDDELRTSRERDRDAESLLHAAGESADGFLARVPQVGLHEQRVHQIATLAAVRDAFHLREVIEHPLGAQVRIESELLREVAKNLSDVVGLREDVDLAEPDGARIRFLERGYRAHERRLPRTVGPEQAEHASGYVERDVLQGAYTVGIRLREIRDRKVHEGVEGGATEAGKARWRETTAAAVSTPYGRSWLIE